jgi:HK97 family phage major capsid protein
MGIRLVHGIDLSGPGGLAKLFAHHRAQYGNAVMLTRLDEIRTRQSAIQTSLTDLEAGEDTEDNRTRSDALLEEWDELKTELVPLAERAAKIAAVRAAMADEANLEDGSDGEQTNIQRMSGTTGPDFHQRAKIDPFKGLEDVKSGLTSPEQVRSRAMQAVDDYHTRSDHWQLSDSAAENAARLIQKGGKAFGTNIARQMLSTGSPEYLAAFEAYLTDPGGYAARAALSLTSANGGYLVPFTLDPTIILTNSSSANPYRQIATVKTTTTNNWNGVTSAGMSAEWTAEGTEAADATPTVGNLQIVPTKADAYLFGSFEVLSDSDFASQMPDLLADAKDRIEETAFAVGTGSTQPNGVIPRGTSASMLTGTAATGPNAADVYTLQGALPARWRGPRANNVWLMNLATINKLRNTPKFTGATVSIVDDSGDLPKLLGKPIYESTSILGVYTTGNKVIAYLDARQFYIVDRVGMSIVYDPVVLGTNRRPTGQGAWYSFWRVGSDVSTSNAVRVGSTLT